MKWTPAAAVALIAAVSLAPAAHWGAAPVAAATPTPAALQYDEISRPLVPPNTPPPPDAFAADYQAAAAAQTPKPHGFNPFTAIHDAQEMMKAVNAGRVTRYAFYNGWIRADDVNAQTATIEKCDRHQYIKLDLAKRTYSITTEAPPCPTPTQYSGAPPAQGESGGSGSMDITMNVTTTNLAPMTIDGLQTTGVDRALELKMSNATGSCRSNTMIRPPLTKGASISSSSCCVSCRPTTTGAGLRSGTFSGDRPSRPRRQSPSDRSKIRRYALKNCACAALVLE